MDPMQKNPSQEESSNFIQTFIEQDIAENGRFAGQRVHTRFPP